MTTAKLIEGLTEADPGGEKEVGLEMGELKRLVDFEIYAPGNADWLSLMD